MGGIYGAVECQVSWPKVKCRRFWRERTNIPFVVYVRPVAKERGRQEMNATRSSLVTDIIEKYGCLFILGSLIRKAGFR
jgi:hypothetical protein